MAYRIGEPLDYDPFEDQGDYIDSPSRFSVGEALEVNPFEAGEYENDPQASNIDEPDTGGHSLWDIPRMMGKGAAGVAKTTSMLQSLLNPAEWAAKSAGFYGDLTQNEALQSYRDFSNKHGLSAKLNEYGETAEKYYDEKLTPAMKKSMEKTILASAEEEGYLGEGIKDPWKIGGMIAESIPSTLISMGSGALITKNLIQTGLKTAPKIVQKIIQRQIEKHGVNAVAGVIGGALGEGGYSGLENANSAYDEMMNTPQAELAKSKTYQEIYNSLPAKLTAEQKHDYARKTLAMATAGFIGSVTAVSTGLLGAPSGAFMGKLIGGQGGKSFWGNLLKGAFTEGFVEEMPQSGVEKFVTNFTRKFLVDPNQPWLEGVGEAMAGGAITGFAMGGGMAVVAGREGAAAPSDAKKILTDGRDVKAKDILLGETEAERIRRATKGKAYTGAESIEAEEEAAEIPGEELTKIPTPAPAKEVPSVSKGKGQVPSKKPQRQKPVTAPELPKGQKAPTPSGVLQKPRQDEAPAVERRVTPERPAWDEPFRALVGEAKKQKVEKFVETGAKRIRAGDPAILDLARRMGKRIELDTKLDDALKTVHARIQAGMEPRKRTDEMTERELKEAITTDYLTGLKSKHAFDIEDDRKAHVASIDLDSLKYFNDTFGHQAGDEILINFGNALKGINADAYHISGDEYVIQHDNPAELKRILDEDVIKNLKAQPITVTMPDGKKIKYEVQFSYGTGQTISESEEALAAHKELREATGLRSGRGEVPRGILENIAEGRPPGGERQKVSEKDLISRYKAQIKELERVDAKSELYMPEIRAEVERRGIGGRFMSFAGGATWPQWANDIRKKYDEIEREKRRPEIKRLEGKIERLEKRRKPAPKPAREAPKKEKPAPKPKAKAPETPKKEAFWSYGHLQTPDRYDQWWNTLPKARDTLNKIVEATGAKEWAAGIDRSSLKDIVAAIDSYDNIATQAPAEPTRPAAVTEFSSGGSRISDIEAHIEQGLDIGVVAGEVSMAGLKRLADHAKAGNKVYVDSGAFAAFTGVKNVGWDKVFSNYDKLVHWTGPEAAANLYLTAPDIIGDQGRTLNLIRGRSKDLKSLIDRGANILAPIQKGEMAPSEFYRQISNILGNKIVPAVPSNKKAFSTTDLEDLLTRAAEFPSIHFLGISARNKKFPGFKKLVNDAAPGLPMSVDASTAMKGTPSKDKYATTQAVEGEKGEGPYTETPVEAIEYGQINPIDELWIERAGKELKIKTPMDLIGYIQNGDLAAALQESISSGEGLSAYAEQAYELYRYAVRLEAAKGAKRKEVVSGQLEKDRQKSNTELTIMRLGPVGTKIRFKKGFNKEIYTITDIEPNMGKVSYDGGKVFRFASEFEAVTEEDLKISKLQPIKTTKGDETRIITPANRRGYLANYALAELDDLIASHNAQTFQKNPDYPEGIQERTYHTDPQEQQKVIMQAQNLAPSILLSDDPTPTNGPPMIAPSGIVLGGNSRAMSIDRAYKTKLGKQYAKALASNAHKFGIEHMAVTTMKKPVLVRLVTLEKDDTQALHRIATDFNKSLTQGMSAEAEIVSMGKNLSIETIEKIGLRMANRNLTLRELLGNDKDGKEILDWLISDGVLAETDRGRFVSTKFNLLNDFGKTMIEKAVFGSIIDDADLLNAAPKVYQNKVGRMLPSLAKIKARGDQWDITPQVKDALELATKAKAQDLSIREFQAQGALFGDKKTYSDISIALANLIMKENMTKLANRMKTFAGSAMADVKDQTFLFEPQSFTQAFEEAFDAKVKAPALEAPKTVAELVMMTPDEYTAYVQKRARPPFLEDSGIDYAETVEIEETGETIERMIDAPGYLNDIDEQIASFDELINCMAGKSI